jgi:hypothetical protein
MIFLESLDYNIDQDSILRFNYLIILESNNTSVVDVLFKTISSR